jgi:hypothetical protein
MCYRLEDKNAQMVMLTENVLAPWCSVLPNTHAADAPHQNIKKVDTL